MPHPLPSRLGLVSFDLVMDVHMDKRFFPRPHPHPPLPLALLP